MSAVRPLRRVSQEYVCRCGVDDIDRCLAGLDCDAERITKAHRQEMSKQAEADRPRRAAERAAQERQDHAVGFAEVFERLVALGLDPDDLADALRGRGRQA